MMNDRTTPPYALKDLIVYFLFLGATGFGGPVALIGAMHRDLVVKRQWISQADYNEGLALSQFSPGPVATQLAIYLGYLHYRILGATLAVLAFIAPSFFLVLLLGVVYKIYGGLPWIHAVFYSVGACVIGILMKSSYALTTKTLAKDRFLWGIAIMSACFTIAVETGMVWLFLAAGCLSWLVKAPPTWLLQKRKWGNFLLAPVTAFFMGNPAVSPKTLWTIALFFGKAGAFVFGSGLAIIPFLFGGLVNDYHWITAHEFLDAVAVAMITPGPVIITVGFIGFLIAGLAGASVAALSVFFPCYLFTILLTPHFRKHGKRPGIAAFVAGVTAAATGAITGSVVVLGRRSLTDVPTMLICLVTVIILWKTKKVPEPIIVLAAAVFGFFFF